MHLSSFWASAARLSGRIDLSPLRPHLGEAPPPLAILVDAGVAPRHAQALRAGAPLDVDCCALRLIDPGYPPPLGALPHAPPVLFVQGDATLLRAPCVAVVGSRRCTQTGLQLARALARAVVDLGGVVVSGLAHGIDHAAHEVVPGRTVAVLGQGFGPGLTRHQQRLADAILDAGGALTTELLPGTPATRWTFPQRNRVIAGLAHGVVVVEASARSGALITARQALAAGREVLAVPGSPLWSTSRGCLDLIADGAGLIRDVRDVRALLPDAPGPAARQRAAQLSLALEQGLAEGLDVDRLAARCGLDAAELGRTLTALELGGVVRRLPGDRFTLREGS